MESPTLCPDKTRGTIKHIQPETDIEKFIAICPLGLPELHRYRFQYKRMQMKDDFEVQQDRRDNELVARRILVLIERAQHHPTRAEENSPEPPMGPTAHGTHME